MSGDAGRESRGLPLAGTLDLIPLGVCVINSKLVVSAWNRTLVEWTGIPREEALGMNLAERFPGLKTARIQGRLRAVFDAGSPAVFSAAIHKHFLEVPSRHGPRGSLMVQQTQVRLLPEDPDLALVTIDDVTSEASQLAALRAERVRLVSVQARLLASMEEAESARKRVERLHSELQETHVSLERKNIELAQLAATDALTGLANRRRFHEALDNAFSLAMRESMPLSLVMLDIDSFKKYNDEHGHLAGDDVLRRASEILLTRLRSYDTAARYGGEEFVLLLPMTDARSALQIAERIRGDIEHSDWPHAKVTSSFGVATISESVSNAAELLGQADQALYCSKGLGRNRVTLFQDMDQFAEQLRRLEATSRSPQRSFDRELVRDGRSATNDSSTELRPHLSDDALVSTRSSSSSSRPG